MDTLRDQESNDVYVFVKKRQSFNSIFFRITNYYNRKRRKLYLLLVLLILSQIIKQDFRSKARKEKTENRLNESWNRSI